MAVKGKLIGAILGSFAGPMGTILGGLVGHLFDTASEEYRHIKGSSASTIGVDSVSTAQLNFLSSLIGLSIAVANADRHVRVSQIKALKNFFRENFPYSDEDHYLISNIIDETFLYREKLDINGLCGYYRSVSSLAGRLLLLRLLFKIALADQLGLGTQEEELIQRVSALLGVDAYNYRSIRAEFIKKESSAYRILGVSRDASEEDIRSAFRKLAAQHHPDMVDNLGEEFIKVAEEKFKVINEAYEEIKRERGF